MTRPSVAAWIALSIAFVAVVHALLPRHLYQLAGPGLFADRLLHLVTPALFELYWLLFVPKRSLRPRHLLW